MSNSKNWDALSPELRKIMESSTEPPKPDYTRRIARTGEPEYACIMRNRSGIDAGNIDFGLRDLQHLSEADKQDICDTALVLYESICRQTKKQAQGHLVKRALEPGGER
jgi:hypothetical protein